MNNNSQEELENQEISPIEENGEQEVKGIEHFIQKNSKVIIFITIAIVAVVGIVYLVILNNSKTEANASKALARIEEYYAKGEYDNALKGNDTLPMIRGEKIIGLIDIVNEYGSTDAGERAALYAADAYFNLGDYKEAKNYYEKSMKSGIDVVRVGGLAGTAACDEVDGRYKEAASNYLKAAELIVEDGQKLRYMYFAGLCNEKAGNNEEALKNYKNILSLNKYGEFNNLAKAGIVRLGSTIE